MACNVTCVRHSSELVKTKWLAIEAGPRLAEKHRGTEITPHHGRSNQYHRAQGDECSGRDHHVEGTFEGRAAMVCGDGVVEDRKRTPHTHGRTQFGFIERATACAHFRELSRRESSKI